MSEFAGFYVGSRAGLALEAFELASTGVRGEQQRYVCANHQNPQEK